MRYLTRLGNLGTSTLMRGRAPRTQVSAEVDAKGFYQGPTLDAATVAALNAIYRPRGEKVVPKSSGAPFVNLVEAADFTPDHPIMKLAFSPEVLDPAIDYFGGDIVLDSVQVLYSYPTENMRESQYWHRDYGDSKSFHCVVYLNDVDNIDQGPFVFVDKSDTRRIRNSAIIRRIDDTQFTKELGDGEVRYFYGKAGESVFVDPAVCYHYGSRCKQPRYAIFITFNTSMPFVKPQKLISSNADRLLDVGRALRPDLSEGILKSMLQLN
ncbi:MAG: hypothetical protein ABS76_26845 [Pelagibacterium sp. SCN 64-44]|nr:MAG: hypothetical protein ABS76_26845 [Pelagibacterium sp. SCN 64-44]